MKEYPNNPEAEKWLLGSIFQHPKAMAQFACSLEPADFYGEKNRIVWKAMQELQAGNAPIDIVTVGSRLEKESEFQSLFGNNDYLFCLSESVPSAANADYYVELIAKASALRKLIFASQRTLSEAWDPAAEADALLSSAMERIAAIASRSAKSDDEHLADVLLEVLDGIRDRMEQGATAGTQTGFSDLDNLTGGLRGGELIILGARTGMGKSSLAIDIALEAARKMPVKFFSLEMTKRQLAPRAASFFSRVNLKRTINADLSENELLLQYKTVEEIRKLNIYAEFGAAMKIAEICAECHAFAARHGAGLVVIDHLHFIEADGKKYENRNIELGKITHALKELAKKLDIPILLLSQLNRDIDRASAKDKMPRLSDLRDSGNIEQDADMVWFIHRPGYYPEASEDPSVTYIKIAKNRNGPTGKVELHFDTETTKFSNKQIPASPINWSLY